jgi:hypothetical protein
MTNEEIEKAKLDGIAHRRKHWAVETKKCDSSWGEPDSVYLTTTDNGFQWHGITLTQREIPIVLTDATQCAKALG